MKKKAKNKTNEKKEEKNEEAIHSHTLTPQKRQKSHAKAYESNTWSR